MFVIATFLNLWYNSGGFWAIGRTKTGNFSLSIELNWAGSVGSGLALLFFPICVALSQNHGRKKKTGHRALQEKQSFLEHK